MSDNQPPGPWQQPANNGTWGAPPEPTYPQYQPGAAAPGGPTYPPTTPFPGATPAEPTQPYGQPAGTPPAYGQPASTPPAYGQPTSAQPDYAAQVSYGQQPAVGGYTQSPYGQPTTTPWQTQPPKQRRTGLIVAIVVIVLVVLCGGLITVGVVVSKSGTKTNAADCSGGGSGTTSGGGGGGSTTPSKPTIALGDSAALKAALLPYPSGAKHLSVDGGDNGVFTLDQFNKTYFGGDSDEKSRLQERGFQVAVEKQWISKNIEVHIQLIQFADSDGAKAYVDGQHDAYTSDSSVTSTYDVSGIDDGYGYEESALDKLGNRRATLMGMQDRIAIVVFIFTPNQFDRSSEDSILTSQGAALPSS